MTEPADVQATFCATVVDEWVRAGIGHAVVSPGSRSTPLALALAGDDRIAVHVFHDERSAGFAALGMGIASGRPVPVVTTSGTAAVELHPAVVEAHHGRVPMLAVTADRPRRLWGTGAPQTIDQTRLYGGAVRWFAEPGVPRAAGVGGWRILARRLVEATIGPMPGPVHLNLELDEPLVGRAGDLAPPLDADAGDATETAASPPSDDLIGRAVELLSHDRVLVVAGGRHGGEHLPVLSAAQGWPLVTDVQAAPSCHLERIHGFDSLLRHAPFAETERPSAVLWVGERPASRVLDEWVAQSGAVEVVVGAPPAIDPGRRAAVVLEGDEVDLVATLDARLRVARKAHLRGVGWAERWRTASRAGQAAVARVLAGHERVTEPHLAREVVRTAVDGSVVVVASSMPVRDVEWYAEPGSHASIRANRGANGIDGVVSTALGIALAGGWPVRALVGDLAFLHDAGALIALRDRDVDLTIVVVDNDGGGIFSFLPQAAGLPPHRFEQLFGTPHGTDVAMVARAHGLPATVVEEAADLGPALAGPGGPRVVVARTERGANVEVHREIHAAVAAALTDEGWVAAPSGSGPESVG